MFQLLCLQEPKSSVTAIGAPNSSGQFLFLLIYVSLYNLRACVCVAYLQAPASLQGSMSHVQPVGGVEAVLPHGHDIIQVGEGRALDISSMDKGCAIGPPLED